MGRALGQRRRAVCGGRIFTISSGWREIMKKSEKGYKVVRVFMDEKLQKLVDALLEADSQYVDAYNKHRQIRQALIEYAKNYVDYPFGSQIPIWADFNTSYVVRPKMRVVIKDPDLLPKSLAMHAEARTTYSLNDRGKIRLRKTLHAIGTTPDGHGFEGYEDVSLRTLEKEYEGMSEHTVLVDWLDAHAMEIKVYYEVVQDPADQGGDL
jgi:hypothetical protein